MRTNQPFGEVKKRFSNAIDPADIPVCECQAEKPCDDDECLNRLLFFECHPSSCPTGEKCRNQRFQKRLYPKLSVFKTANDRGWGLKVNEDVAVGSFISEYVGELIDDEEHRRRLDHYHKLNETNFYMLTIDSNTIIDAGPKGNQTRFINHSCNPNCDTQKWTVDGATRVGFFANKLIKAGSELTFNYQFECKGDEKTVCHCGAERCSGFLGVRVKGARERKSGGGGESAKMKQRKRRKLKPLKVTDDWCYRCLEGGELVLCDQISCPKGYHLECLSRDSLPVGKWLCPRHICDYCTKTTTKQCALCPASFCDKHDTEENIYFWGREDDDGKKVDTLVCTDHSKEELKTRYATLSKGERERDENFRIIEQRRMLKSGAGSGGAGESRSSASSDYRKDDSIDESDCGPSSGNVSSEAGEEDSMESVPATSLGEDNSFTGASVLNKTESGAYKTESAANKTESAANKTESAANKTESAAIGKSTKPLTNKASEKPTANKAVITSFDKSAKISADKTAIESAKSSTEKTGSGESKSLKTASQASSLTLAPETSANKRRTRGKSIDRSNS